MSYTPLRVYDLGRLVAQLRDAGFNISSDPGDVNSVAKVEHYIPIIGQARFEEYAHPFIRAMESRHISIGVNNVLKLYKFDRKLRLLSLDAIERIEVSIKSLLLRELIALRGPGWFKDRTFLNEFNHNLDHDIRADIQRSPTMKDPNGKSRAIGDFPELRIMDALSYGRVEKLLEGLPRRNRIAIAKHFPGVPEKLMVNWFSAFRVVRNVAAHHTRLWNVRFKVTPIVHRDWAGTYGDPGPGGWEARYYVQAMAMFYLLKRIARNTRWHCRLLALMHSDLPEHIDIAGAMGFPANWHKTTFWDIDHCFKYFSRAQL